MARRPFYFVTPQSTVKEGSADFEWFPGFAVSQKQQSISSFHQAIGKLKKKPLEISTKGLIPLGVRLSAFNLKIGGYFLENIFQSSKVFSKGGPFSDLLDVSPKDAKRDPRLRESGNLTAFRYNGTDWPLLPKTAFYDWLYYNAVRENLSDEELRELCEYDAFTDIEFNPSKSINTQARSAALVVAVYKTFGTLPKINEEEFLRLHRNIIA